MLTLQNKGLATDFYNWKRANAQELKKLEHNLIDLPFNSKQNPVEIEIPENISNWFTGLELLQGVPFNYLVPDEKMLPPESIRFFCVDSLWVDCLQDGAFSIGRVTGADIVEDAATRSRQRHLTRSVDQQITGIILRSQVVAGWPGLLVDGYDESVADSGSIDETEANLLPLIRMEKLAKDVLICLFQGEVKTVDIHQKPEAMHFGVDPFGVEETSITKGLRNAEGDLIEQEDPIDIPWNNRAKKVINLNEFAEAMKTWFNSTGGGSIENFTSAQFGLQMIEGVQKVRFVMS